MLLHHQKPRWGRSGQNILRWRTELCITPRINIFYKLCCNFSLQNLMRFLTLTSASSNFEYSNVDKTLICKWNINHDFSNISYVGISSLMLTGFKHSRSENFVHVSTNIINRTIANPTRNILNLCIRRNSTVASCQLNMSEYFSIQWFTRPRKFSSSTYIKYFSESRDWCHSSRRDYTTVWRDWIKRLNPT